MASQGKATSSAMPAITSSSTGVSLPPLPAMLQKNNETGQKKSTAVFQGSKSSGNSSSNTTNDVSLLVSQMRTYMEQQERTNQKLFREIDEMKKMKKPVEDPSPLIPRVLDFASPDTNVQQTRVTSSQAHGSSFRP